MEPAPGETLPAPGEILVVNAGSTSVKLAAFPALPSPSPLPEEPSWSVHAPASALGPDRADGIAGLILEHLGAGRVHAPRVAAAGHRIVHGGERFDHPVVLDPQTEDAIAALSGLAPIHNRAGLDGIAAVRRVLGSSVPQVAVFDTAFHRTIPLAAAAYGGPYEWIARGLRRYGFHGISHAYAAGRASALLRRELVTLRLVTCHLGGGCSLAAIDGGRSVDTTMGLTPLDGLVMATRSGSVDPALVLHLLREGQSADDVDQLLEHRSGLLGLSGVSADLREVLQARDQDNPRAMLAIDVFVHRLVSSIGAMAASLGGIDGLVFTGGIGEHSSEIRSRVAGQLAFLGMRLDETANGAMPVDGIVSSLESAVAVLVVRAREEREIARATIELLGP